MLGFSETALVADRERGESGLSTPLSPLASNIKHSNSKRLFTKGPKGLKQKATRTPPLFGGLLDLALSAGTAERSRATDVVERSRSSKRKVEVHDTPSSSDDSSSDEGMETYPPAKRSNYGKKSTAPKGSATKGSKSTKRPWMPDEGNSPLIYAVVLRVHR